MKFQVPGDLDPVLPALTQARYSEGSRYYYELMSGGLVWEDEAVDLTVEQSNFLRMVWAFRTAKILDIPRPELRPFWDSALAIAPEWIGFRAERCMPSEEIIQYLVEAKRKAARKVDRYEKAASGEWRPLAGRAE